MKKSKLVVYLVVVPQIETEEKSRISTTLSTSLTAYVHRTRAEAVLTQEIYGGLLLRTTADALNDLKEDRDAYLSNPDAEMEQAFNFQNGAKAAETASIVMVCGDSLPYEEIRDERGPGDCFWKFPKGARQWLTEFQKQAKVHLHL